MPLAPTSNIDGVTTGVDSGDRKQRRREEVKARLRTALRNLARDRPYGDIKVADVTAEAGLSRSAFYFYYDHKRDLLIEVVKRISDEIYDLSTSHFASTDDPREIVRAVLRGNAEAWARHADMLRLATEASASDEDVQRFWRGTIEDFTAAVATRMRADQARGLVAADLDPDTCAEVMVTGTEGFFYRKISSRSLSPDEAVEALAPIWLRLLYPRAQPRERSTASRQRAISDSRSSAEIRGS